MSNENHISCFPDTEEASKSNICSSEFSTWQVQNKYFKKQFSILGDSISTLEGYNPAGYKVFYTGDNCIQSGVRKVADTWWDKVIGFFGGELLVNNSWSGSRVTKLPYEREIYPRESSDEAISLFPSGCSDERTSSLHIGDVKPDVILVYLGTNDWAFGAKVGDGTCLLGGDINEYFEYAYENMLDKLKINYPQSEIWCCTLSETYIAKRPDFQFPHKYAGKHIEEYNEVIRRVVRDRGCKLIDLYQCKTPYDSVDGSHPTKSGMDTIANMVIRSMADSEAGEFLDCKEEQHHYKEVEQYTGATRYACMKCGKEKISMILPQESEYVMLDPARTVILYPNTLRLTIESTGKIVKFEQDMVTVGRDAKCCDLVIDGKEGISRRHASFIYENSAWFLRDNESTNGTWLNGAKIQPGKKYQIEANDEINFATMEKMFFYKTEQEKQGMEDSDAKSREMLELGIEKYVQSGFKDEVAWKLIIFGLKDTSLYFPVEIDTGAMLEGIDPAELKPGDILQTQSDTKLRILTLETRQGGEAIPVFTSDDEINKGPLVSSIRMYPQDYLPKLLEMGKDVVINPFSEYKLPLKPAFFEDFKNLFFKDDTVLLQPEGQATNEQATNEQSVAGRVEDAQPLQQQPPAEQEYSAGQIVAGRYEILDKIGQGYVSKVYRVRDNRIGKVWVMKVCSKKERNFNPVIRDAIVKETCLMKQLAHPAIPAVIDIQEDEDAIYIVRDYIEGETLEASVTKYGAQPLEAVVAWGRQLCDVLGYLHSQMPPIIYRDMKPANVMLTRDGWVKLIDFGIARTYKENQKEDTCFLGTRWYAAPEQYGGTQTDARTDIYGLGMTMFRLVTGVNLKDIQGDIQPIRTYNSNLPTGLEYIITKCTQPNPADRYQSCTELMADLNDYLNLPKPKGVFGKLFGKK